jgi:hypothetical protein
MRTGTLRVGALFLLLSALASCDLPPMISDTGYRGTWRRGNDRVVSIVAITESAGRWYFRWTKWSSDGRLTVRCDWDGRCEERLDGKRVVTYTITPRFDAASGKLWLDTVEESVEPGRPARRYTEVMDVRDGGLTLRNVTIDRDGQHFEGLMGPQRSFTKIANSVADPPGSTHP